MREMQRRIIEELRVEPSIDPAKEIEKRVQFLKDYLLRLGANGYVLGVSGGQDSTLAGRLTQLAVEEAQVASSREFTFLAIRLPYGIQRDEEDAQAALQFIKPSRHVTINIKPAVDASAEAFRRGLGCLMTDYIKGNAKARERMKVQYDIAGQYGLLVVGTDHAAEAVTGFSTKFGDGAADVMPLAGLTKRQGRQLLVALGAPALLYNKVPIADLLDEKPDQTDEEALGLTYQQLDDYLEGKDIEPLAAEKLERRYLATRHKRHLPLTPADTWWHGT